MAVRPLGIGTRYRHNCERQQKYYEITYNEYACSIIHSVRFRVFRYSIRPRVARLVKQCVGCEAFVYRGSTGVPRDLRESILLAAAELKRYRYTPPP